MATCEGDAPRPPYSTGQWIPAQPPACNVRCQSRRRFTSSDVVGKPTTSGGACAASHERSSSLKASSSDGMRVRLGTAGRPGNGLQLRVLEQAVVAVFTADAGVLVAAEWAPEMWPAGTAVDADRPGLQFLGDLVGAHRIGVPDGGRQPVAAVVG